MKKILGTALIVVFSCLNANAEITVGISGNAGLLSATGKETFNSKTQTKSDDMGIAYLSGFAEIHLPMNIGPGKFRVGASIVPYALESEATTSERAAGEYAANNNGEEYTPKAAFSQNVQVDLKDLRTAYLSYHVEQGFFIKGGVIEADLITNEVLGSGSSYPNAALDGSFYGVGFDRDIPNGIFVRGEVTVTEFDNIKLSSTGSTNAKTIDITGLSGTNIAISVGKTF